MCTLRCLKVIFTSIGTIFPIIITCLSLHNCRVRCRLFSCRAVISSFIYTVFTIHLIYLFISNCHFMLFLFMFLDYSFSYSWYSTFTITFTGRFVGSHFFFRYMYYCKNEFLWEYFKQNKSVIKTRGTKTKYV